MSMVAKTASLLETVLGPEADELARRYGVIQRQRKFTGTSLLRMLVLTLLKNPRATFTDWAVTAAQLQVPVSATAVEKRFTRPLVDFLREVLSVALRQLFAAEPISIELLDRFTGLFVGDSSVIPLPDELRHELPGCGGTDKVNRAALKIQVLWNLKTGALPLVSLEPGKASDCQSPVAQRTPSAGSLEIFDLGYFSVERLRRVSEGKAFFISRLPPGMKLFDATGQEFSLLKFLSTQQGQAVIDQPIQLGIHERLGCRLIAIRAEQQIADRRRRKVRKKARRRGRKLSWEQSRLCGWTIFVTNAAEELLSWKEVVVLYRARWQIELLFKLWKSHNQLTYRRPGASTWEILAVLWAKLIGVMLQHWLLLTAAWQDARRSLWKVARALQDWIVPLLLVLDQRRQLEQTIAKLQTQLRQIAKTQSRRQKPSLFQLLQNPELLEWNP